jgi:dihydroorotate dehydrogenase
MFYRLIRWFLFLFEPETSHKIAVFSMKMMRLFGLSGLLYPAVRDEVKIWGLTFPNRIGLAGGFDKNGAFISELFSLGFGFVEIGTVTPLAQPGNPKPRQFRIPSHHALINRMGFNNEGVEALVKNVKKAKRSGILGISIGKNAKTTEAEALNDYLKCLDAVYEYADYIAVNISSPNTKGLRNLQLLDTLPAFLKPLKEHQAEWQKKTGKFVPLLVKIAPDLALEDVRGMGQIFLDCGIDGVIATNTTVTRDAVQDSPYAGEAGGLSGEPVKALAYPVIKEMAAVLQKKIPLIASGGVMSAQDVKDYIAVGADLVQIYTGFLYKGPAFIAEAAKAIKEA